MLRFVATLIACLTLAIPATAQQADAPIQKLLQSHSDLIVKSSRRTIGPAIDALANSGLPQAQVVMDKWQTRQMWVNTETGLFIYAEEVDRDTLRIFDFADGTEIGEVPDDGYDQLKPNSGIRGLIGTALVQFQLSDPEPDTRRRALDAIERGAEESHLAALRASLGNETDTQILARKQRLERLLTIAYGETDAERIEAIQSFEGDLGVDVRAALNQIGRAHV